MLHRAVNIHWVKSHLVLTNPQYLTKIFSFRLVVSGTALSPILLQVHGTQSSQKLSLEEKHAGQVPDVPRQLYPKSGHSQLGRVELSQLLPLRLDYSRISTGNPASSVSRLVLPGEAAERYPGLPSFPLEGWEEQGLPSSPGSKMGWIGE